MEVLREDNRQRRDYHVEQDYRGEKAIPGLDSKRVGIELVPWHSWLFLDLFFVVTVEIFILIFTLVFANSATLPVKVLMTFPLLCVFLHLGKALSQPHKHAYFCPKLADAFPSLLLVHFVPWLGLEVLLSYHIRYILVLQLSLIEEPAEAVQRSMTTRLVLCLLFCFRHLDTVIRFMNTVTT